MIEKGCMNSNWGIEKNKDNIQENYNRANAQIKSTGTW